MSAAGRRLTVVVPVHNEAAGIAATLEALDEAVARSPFLADVIVVDDGSHDGSDLAARLVTLRCPLVVIEQENLGRFRARRRGLLLADGELCLLLDARVRLEPDALAFVATELASGEPAKEVWNGHVEIDADGGPYSVFWQILTARMFSEYFSDPRTTSFGLEDFDRFPKGFGCFLAPREVLVEAFAAHQSAVSDLRHSNDDTPIIRWIAARTAINISPGFACRYATRTTIRPFLRHAYHRGGVFVDGHGRRESSLRPVVIALYVGSVVWLVASARSRAARPAPFASASAVGAAFAVIERRPRDAATMAWVTPLYAAAHVAGMWRALVSIVRDRVTGAA